MTHRLTDSLIVAADIIERHERLLAELAQLGQRKAARCYRYGEDYAVACWDSMPGGVEIGGELWTAIERGFCAEWHRRRRGE